MHRETQADPSVIVKDAFRGIRFALKRGARMVEKDGPRQLPEQFEAASDVYFGRSQDILNKRERIKRKTLETRRLQHRKLAA